MDAPARLEGARQAAEQVARGALAFRMHDVAEDGDVVAFLPEVHGFQVTGQEIKAVFHAVAA